MSAVRDNKPWLVFLPGWGFKEEAWAPVMAVLKPYFECLALALPKCDEADINFKDDGLKKILQPLAGQIPQGAHICGWSLGGLLAIKLLELWPSALGKVMTVGTNVSFVQDERWPHALEDAVLDGFITLYKSNPQHALQRFCRLVTLGEASQRQWLKVLAQQQTALSNTHIDGLYMLKNMRINLTNPNLKERWLGLYASEDSLVPSNTAKALSQLGFNASLLPGASHAVPLTEPNAIAQQALAYLYEQSAHVA